LPRPDYSGLHSRAFAKPDGSIRRLPADQVCGPAPISGHARGKPGPVTNTLLSIDAGMGHGDIICAGEHRSVQTETILSCRAMQYRDTLRQRPCAGIRDPNSTTDAAKPLRSFDGAEIAEEKKREHRLVFARSGSFNSMRGSRRGPALNGFRGATCQIWGEPVSKDH